MSARSISLPEQALNKIKSSQESRGWRILLYEDSPSKIMPNRPRSLFRRALPRVSATPFRENLVEQSGPLRIISRKMVLLQGLPTSLLHFLDLSPFAIVVFLRPLAISSIQISLPTDFAPQTCHQHGVAQLHRLSPLRHPTINLYFRWRCDRLLRIHLICQFGRGYGSNNDWIIG